MNPNAFIPTGGSPAITCGGNRTDIRIAAVRTAYSDYSYRTPIKFGGVVVSCVTLLNVECDVITRQGNYAQGFGSMPLANSWAFPSRELSQEQTLHAMRALAERCARVCNAFSEFGHPIEIGIALEDQFMTAAQDVTRELALEQSIPKLCALVCGSAFDAAIHDAFGKAHALNCYQTYGRDFMNRDLSTWLGADYSGEWPDAYVRREPLSRMPLYHLVGAVDPIDESELAKPINDGLPETLPQWIRFNGLTHLKIKLNGNDLAWDLARIVKVDRVTAEAQAKRGNALWCYSLDFNECCENVQYLIELIHKVRELAPAAFDRVQYIEQPTARDLRAHPENRMHEAAKLKPVVIDESLTDYESLLLARSLGYSGVALKACKGQSQSLLMAAATQKLGLFLCVQDLSCPGASLIHSAGLAAHVPGVAAIESNSRQYCPEANRGWDERFPGIFKIRDGFMYTSSLTSVGLGAIPPAIDAISGSAVS